MESLIDKYRTITGGYWKQAVILIKNAGSDYTRLEFLADLGLDMTTKQAERFFPREFGGLTWTQLRNFIWYKVLPDKFKDKADEFNKYL